MPTVMRIGRFRFFFYSNENAEPPRVHVQAAELEAKVWLDPVIVEANYGFRDRDLRELVQHVRDHQAELLEAWHGYFG